MESHPKGKSYELGKGNSQRENPVASKSVEHSPLPQVSGKVKIKVMWVHFTPTRVAYVKKLGEYKQK